MKHVRGVVFDLDGALAATAALVDRTAYRLLLEVQASGQPPARAWGLWSTGLPGRLICQGYRVAVITAASGSYAWTLSWLLGLDHEYLLPAHSTYDPSVAGKLRALAQEWDLEPARLLYVGDTDSDLAQARAAGTRFALLRAQHPTSWPCLPTVRHPVPAPDPQIVHHDPDARAPDGIDRAVARLRDNTATEADYRLLVERGYCSELLEHGRPASLPPELRALRTTGGDPPWADSRNDGAWGDLLRTGDAGRLLDMNQALLRFRLPDPDLDAALAREAADGGYQTVEDALASLDPMVQKQIALPPRPAHPVRQLQRMLRDISAPDADLAGLADTAWIDDEEKLRLALTVLACDPGHPSRDVLQRVVLRHLPAAALPCLLVPPPAPYGLAVTRPGPPVWLVTRGEYDRSEPLRHDLVAWLSEGLPLQNRGDDLRSCVSYGGPWGQTIWSQVKDWRGTHSGHRVCLDFLELPALVLAGHLRREHATVVAGAPATAFSSRQPARASVRLAERAAAIASLPSPGLLDKRDDGAVLVHRSLLANLDRSRVVVIDDQITTGSTLRRCREALHRHGIPDPVLMAWSRSGGSDRSTVHHDVFGCWLSETFPDPPHPRLTCARTTPASLPGWP